MKEGDAGIVEWQTWLPNDVEPKIPEGLAAGGPWFPFAAFMEATPDRNYYTEAYRRPLVRAVTAEQTSAEDAASALLSTMHLHPHYDLRYRSNWGALLGALDVLCPEAARRLRDGEEPDKVSAALFPEDE